MKNEDVRRERMEMIYNTILKAGKKNKGVNQKKLIAVCCFEFGASDRKVKEYIKVLLLADKIKIKKDNLLWEKKC